MTRRCLGRRGGLLAPNEPPAWTLAGNAIGEALLRERETLVKRLTQQEQSAAATLRAALPDWRRAARYEDLGSKFAILSKALQDGCERSIFLAVNRLLVIDLALRLPDTIATRNIPREVQALYPDAAARLIAYLRDDDAEYCYPNERFVKDLRFASGLTVPCGAQVVDLRSVIGYAASARWLLRHPSAHHIGIALLSRQLVPWFRIHTESRYLDDFNEAGWDACYHRIAALLEDHPDVLGMAGTSWFYDPQLESVSPRLSYLRRRPVAGGAALLRSGTSAFDIGSATATSETRRRLYEAGKYTPVAHTLIWPRQALLDWARRQRAARP